jgi:hypothetical protein
VSIPNALANFCRGQQTVSSFNPDLSFVTCNVARTYDEQFLLVASLPYAVVGLFSLIHVVRVVRHAQREQDTVLNVFDDNRLFEDEVEHNKRELFAEIGGNAGSLLVSSFNNNSRRPSAASVLSHSGMSGLAVLPYISERDDYDALDDLIGQGSLGAVGCDNGNDDGDNAETPHEQHASKSKRVRIVHAPFALSSTQPQPLPATLAERSLQKSLRLQWFDYFAVTVLVVMHMVYPTIIDVSGNLLLCESIDYGADRAARSVLIADRSIDCNSAEYDELRVWAWLHLSIYGAGFPLFIVGFTKVVSAVDGRQHG